jgi:hypothetical protein
VGIVQCGGNLAEIRKVADELKNSELKNPLAQYRLLECCGGDRAAKVAVLGYLMVLRGIQPEDIIIELLLIDIHTDHVSLFNQMRLRVERLLEIDAEIDESSFAVRSEILA